ncbi:MAG: DUF2798 domain-containing protein [Rhizobiaceae bacterium]|nr:DUF2798 domain-containing protein [Rhizobiaceae bacterium]
MIPAKYEIRVFQLLLTGLMTFFVSGAVTLLNLGISGFKLSIWMNAWAPTWPIAFCVIIFAAPIASKIAKRIVNG